MTTSTAAAVRMDVRIWNTETRKPSAVTPTVWTVRMTAAVCSRGSRMEGSTKRGAVAVTSERLKRGGPPSRGNRGAGGPTETYRHHPPRVKPAQEPVPTPGEVLEACRHRTAGLPSPLGGAASAIRRDPDPWEPPRSG